MESITVKRLALVLAIQAKIEGMKAENLIHIQKYKTPKYNEEAFMDKASELENLAYIHDDQL